MENADIKGENMSDKYCNQRYAADDIHSLATERADIRFQDGALGHAVGACCYQVVRAAKKPECSPEGCGFTYNHAPMLAYFCGRFVLEYLGGPSGEHEAPSAAFFTSSSDGIHWQKPVMAFPPVDADTSCYQGPKKEALTGKRIPCIVHHRMGFYTAVNGRLLMMTFYGISPDFHTAPNNGWGVGRAVREIYRDFTLSDIYWLRANEAGGYSRERLEHFPWFEQSPDAGFVDACQELLKNRLVTQQWWEEERLDEGFFTRPGGRALSYYTLPSGRVMGVFKDSLTSFSDDGGEHWSRLKKSVSIVTASGKVWGQKAPDGSYVLAYNPVPDGAHRWPLAIQAGDNGVDFGELLAVVPEISPCRWEGQLKNLGAQYVRGITEANARPEDTAVWLTYSVNKEDIWVARVPVPLRGAEKSERMLDERMQEMTEEELRNHWNLYKPFWNRAELASKDGKKGLLLTDCDPYQRTRAMRMLPAADRLYLRFQMMLLKTGGQSPSVFLQDRHGQNIFSLVFRSSGWLCVRSSGRDKKVCVWKADQELSVSIIVDVVENTVWLSVKSGDEKTKVSCQTAAASGQPERVLFATKYNLPFQGLEVNGRDGTIGNLPGADEPLEECIWWILKLESKPVDRRI